MKAPPDQHEALAFALPDEAWIEQVLPRIVAHERAHLNQRLHDSLCQSLAGAQLLASVLARHLAAEHPTEAAEARAIVEGLSQCGLALRDLTR